MTLYKLYLYPLWGFILHNSDDYTIEMIKDYTSFENMEDIPEYVNEREEDFNHSVRFYKSRILEEEILFIKLGEYDNLLQMESSSYEEFSEEELDYLIDENEKYLDDMIKEHEEYEKKDMESLIEFHENQSVDFEDYEDPSIYDEDQYYYDNGPSFEKLFDDYGSNPINNHLDYGNLVEIDSFSDYLDYKDIDYIDISENYHNSLEVELYSNELNHLDMVMDDYGGDFELDYTDFIDEPADEYDNIISDYHDYMNINEKGIPFELILYEENKIHELDEELDYLVQNHIFEEDRIDHEIESYLKSIEKERLSLLNAIEDYESYKNETEYAADYDDDFDDFHDYDDGDFEGRGEEFDIIYYKKIETNQSKNDEYDSLDDNYSYGDFHYQGY